MCNDWDKMKLEAVEELLLIKFAQPYLRYLLLATEEQESLEKMP